MNEPQHSWSAFEELATELPKADTLPKLFNTSKAYFHFNNITMFSYHHYAPVGSLDYGNYRMVVMKSGVPPGFYKNYARDRMARYDPILKFIHTQLHPFLWSEVSTMIKLTEKEQGFVDALIEVMEGDGLSIPVFGPRGRSGYFSMGFKRMTPEISTSQRAHFQQACQLIHNQYCDLVLQDLPSGVTLSDRERQILILVARGATTPKIASKLDISTNTVETYIRRIFIKLEVDQRVTAALRGVALGLIE